VKGVKLTDEYKALTVVNLPFVGEGKTFQPGEMIPRGAFDENSENELAADADDEIQNLVEMGAISEDPNAELHAAHQPVAPGTPSLPGLVETAKWLVGEMEKQGQDVPGELQQFASLDVQEVLANDNAKSSEASV